MTLSAQDAARNQNDFRLALDAPRTSYRLDTFARNLVRVETIEINATRYNGDLTPGRAVAIIDQLADLLTSVEYIIAARHDAVIKVLENILFAKALIAAGDKRYSAQPRCDKCTPSARATKSVNRTALPIPRHSCQLDRVPQH